jgi:hypothetical protein
VSSSDGRIAHEYPRLRPVAPDVWVVERPQTFYGLSVGARMTVVRLRGDRLWLHSPVRLDPALRAELDAIGSVAFAVAPNRLHHLYADGVREAYPASRLWIAPGLERKRPDLRFAAVLDDRAPEEWAAEIDQIFSRGRPFENEIVFLHRQTRTLIATDLAFHFGPSAPLRTRLAMRLLGSYGRLAPSVLERLLVQDRKAARESLLGILDWQFDRVIIAHGELVEADGKRMLREGYSWLLNAGN